MQPKVQTFSRAGNPPQRRPVMSWTALVKSMRRHDPRVRVVKTDTERRIVSGTGDILAQFPLATSAQEAIIHLATPKLEGTNELAGAEVAGTGTREVAT